MSGKKKKDKGKKWIDAVERARHINSIKQLPQLEIASIALSVCEITWGGNKKEIRENPYTLTRFAKETGITPKTLGNWCTTYRNVYARLPQELKDQVSYTDMAYLAKFVNRETPADAVVKRVENYLSEDTYETKIARYLQHIRSLAHNFETSGAALRCNNKILEEVTFYCQSIMRAIRRDKKGIKGQMNGVARSVNIKALSIARATLGERTKSA